MKEAKIPRIADDATSMKSIHRLSWMAGQWYLWTRSIRRSYTTELVVSVVAIVSMIWCVGLGVRGYGYRRGFGGWVIVNRRPVSTDAFLAPGSSFSSVVFRYVVFACPSIRILPAYLNSFPASKECARLIAHRPNDAAQSEPYEKLRSPGWKEAIERSTSSGTEDLIVTSRVEFRTYALGVA